MSAPVGVLVCLLFLNSGMSVDARNYVNDRTLEQRMREDVDLSQVGKETSRNNNAGIFLICPCQLLGVIC